ncbi:metallophosphoesterase [Alicyclobacillus sacchari]|uniref:metallophosphoesterase family protein n=1 Tax=Alicyclobacillus sacchari TaxID=392010 RepID=UPI0010661A16|nr:metallophosphoesterase family protein [Alicyclobacillus sacchari]GMA57943.1 metallophosphoesterase [Alicyclobacillus sacchari]
MRVAFFSDVHGNELALDAVLHDIREMGCDKVYMLGDICFRGYAPKACLDKVMAVADTVVRGNADEWIVRGVREGEVPPDRLDVMNGERAFALHQLTAEDVKQLADLPMTCESLNPELDSTWLAFHATPADTFAVVAESASDRAIEQSIVDGHPHKLFFYGHIHIPYVRRTGDRTIVNIGSVGMPFDGIAQASYAIVDSSRFDTQIHLRRIPYDVEAACKRYEAAGYPLATAMANVLRTARPL